ncbi:BTB/POZ domain-containing protein At3g49900 isoform X2 [Hevea brasiliensis]|uniref:BTB/POZ domain-containing protein At3g49900 isoform X2 n=1 Tax=Hevea brasiliensis TaxID=3981 RepID=UPI0025CC42F5|nr:BTB/POZ domain-containing protein At3g49900 isoform X2 [Hevea brasiliensis]
MRKILNVLLPLHPFLLLPYLSILESQATGKQTDVLIYVQGTCFHLHKEPLASRSTYLKRQLTELSEITLPLNITAETFALVADFCYGTHVVLTPFNVAALRTAAEVLGMTDNKRDENLRQITEKYFRRVIVVNRELAQIVFGSCLRLLPEAETTAFLLSRCVEALSDDGSEMDRVVDDIIDLAADEFEIVAETMHFRFTCHDVLYRIVDLYIQEHSGKITEEQKMEICNFIDCEKLSPQLLIHAVQNPRLPLRFIVRAMLIEQLNTRRAIFTSTAAATNHCAPQHHEENEVITLGSILQRDAAVREAAQLKEEMDATNSRIESLEKELAGMKKLLQKSEKETSLMEKKLLVGSEKERSIMGLRRRKLEREERSVMGSSRSASFHYGSTDAKIERGERGSTSFAGFRLGVRGAKTGGSSHEDSPRSKKNIGIGMGLIRRLKSTLWVSKSASKSHTKNKILSKEDGTAVKAENEDVSETTQQNEEASHKRRLTV